MAVLNIIAETKESYTSVMIEKMLNVSKLMITAHMTSLKRKDIYKESCQNDKQVFYICPTQKAIDLVEKTKVDLTNQYLLDLLTKHCWVSLKPFIEQERLKQFLLVEKTIWDHVLYIMNG